MYSSIKKRNDVVVKFNAQKIEVALTKAGEATGEYDKKRTKEYPKGQEIYEGDRVTRTEELVNKRTHNPYKKPRFIIYQGTIVYERGAFWFKNDRQIGMLACYLGYDIGHTTLEVIGNIHETK